MEGVKLVYNAIVKKINSDIEEEITVIINDVEFVGFVNTYPYAIEQRKMYPVSIAIIVLDEFKIKSINTSLKEFERINDGFSYKLRGVLRKNGVLESKIGIQDEILIDYAYWYDKFVEIEVDRIELIFEKH